MHDPEGQLAVIGEQQQSLRLTVQPPDRNDPLGNVDQLCDGPPPTFIGERGDIPGRFVEQQVTLPFARGNPAAVDFDVGVIVGNFDAHLGDDFAVDAHPTVADHVLGCPPGGDPARSQHLLEALQPWISVVVLNFFVRLRHGLTLR
jgi:hypothetical protein